MFWSHHSVCFLMLVLSQGFQALEFELRNEHSEQIRSPMLEVFMHLPPNFRDVKSLKNLLGVEKSPRLKLKADPKTIVDFRSYEIAQPAFSNFGNKSQPQRFRREAEDTSQSFMERPQPEKLVSSTNEQQELQSMLPKPDAIRGPVYTTYYPVKEFDIVDIEDPDDPRKRKNNSQDGFDDNSQRDKRTFLEEGTEKGTTPVPFWKRKKENPPFVTGRGGPIQTGNNYTPAQHRSGESARESHSLKNLDKTVQSNEISRSNQDNYYSSTNRRAYSRQSDNPPVSTPKSVYDIIDYSNKRNRESARTDFKRNNDDKKETLRDARPASEQYRQFPYPLPYDRSFYQPPYPYPTEVLGRGVEYYHRTFDPSTGRIIYYANMPENGRSYDYRYDSINRNFYVNPRPYPYDPYYRNYVPPYDYRYMNGFGRLDYMRSGRSNGQTYSYPYQEREKYPRDARFFAGFETANRPRDDLKNKTYIIYDADESRSQVPRPQFNSEGNRLGFTPAPGNNPAGPQGTFRPVPFSPPGDYFPPSSFPFRNQFYPSSTGPLWGFNARATPGVIDSNLNARSPNTPEVQLSLTTSNRGDLNKSKSS